MFRLASPWFLWLLVIPWAYWAWQGKNLFWTGGKKKRSDRAGETAIHFPSLFGGKNRPLSPGLLGARLLPFFKATALSLMIIALARPQAGDQKIKMTTQGVNIILALDLSESMKALDFKQEGKIVTRLTAVKGVVGEFITKREGDRIGMVVFGSNAFTQLPLTRDVNTIAFMLDHLKIGAAGPKTAIGDAIGISIKRLADIEAESNIIILLTDGKSNAGSLSWQDGAKLAAQKGVKIYTIGVGSKGQAPFLVDGFFGKQYVYQNVDVDLDALETIAKETSAEFFRAGDTKALEQIYEMINELEKTEVEVDKWVEYREYYAWFLIPGMGIYLILVLLSNTLLIRIP